MDKSSLSIERVKALAHSPTGTLQPFTPRALWATDGCWEPQVAMEATNHILSVYTTGNNLPHYSPINSSIYSINSFPSSFSFFLRTLASVLWIHLLLRIVVHTKSTHFLFHSIFSEKTSWEVFLNEYIQYSGYCTNSHIILFFQVFMKILG